MEKRQTQATSSQGRTATDRFLAAHRERGNEERVSLEVYRSSDPDMVERPFCAVVGFSMRTYAAWDKTARMAIAQALKYLEDALAVEERQ